MIQHRFPISATEGKHYFDVILFGPKVDMLAWAKENMPGSPEEFGALTCWKYRETPTREGHLGELLFCAEEFAPSIIQHELLHAAFAYERRVYGNVGGVFATPESEERLAYTQQGLLDDMLFKMDDLGLHEYGMTDA